MAFTPPLFTLVPTSNADYHGTLDLLPDIVDRIYVGDIEVTGQNLVENDGDPDLSNVTIFFKWWVDGNQATTYSTNSHFNVTAGMVGHDIQLEISFTHSVTISGVTQPAAHELGWVYFGNAYAGPVAHADVANIAEDGPVLHGSTNFSGVLVNDTSPNGDELKVTDVVGAHDAVSAGNPVQGAYGHLTLTGDGGYSYHLDNTNPLVNELNTSETLYDTFHYTVSDYHGGHSTSTLKIAIHGVSDGGTPQVSDDVHQIVDTTHAAYSDSFMGNVLTNDSAGGSVHVVGVENASATTYGFNMQAFVSDTHIGYLHITSQGHYTFYADESGIDSLGAGQTPSLDFTIHVSNGHGGVADEHLIVDFSGANDAPVPSALSGSATEDGTIDGDNGYSWTSGLVQSGFSDPEGDSVHLVSVNGIAFTGALHLHTDYGDINFQLTAEGYSTSYRFTIDNNSTLVQHLAQSQTHRLEIDLTASDGHGGVAVDPLYITISGVNDAFTVADDVAALNDGKIYVNGSLTGNVLLNDHDGDNNSSLEVVWANFGNIYSGSAVSCSEFGSLHLFADGDYFFDINAVAVNQLSAAFHTTLHYTFSVSDGYSGPQIEHLDIVIQGANDAPLAFSDPYATFTEDNICHTATSLDVMAGVFDPEGNDFTLVSWSETHLASSANITSKTSIQTDYGVAHLDSSGHFRFTLDNSSTAVQGLGAGETRELTFVLGVSDSQHALGAVDVDITIYGVNDDIAIADNFDNVYDVAYNPGGACDPTGDVLCNDHDVDRHDVITINYTGSTSERGGLGNILDGGGDKSGNVICPHEFIMEGQYGTLHLFSTGQYTFDVNQCAVNELSACSTTCTNFTFHVTDHHGGGGFEHLTIQIHGANEAPTYTGSGVYGSVTEDSHCPTTSGFLLCNFHDADNGDGLSVVAVSCSTIPTETGYITVDTCYGDLHVSRSGDYTFTLDNSSSLVQGLGVCETHQLSFDIKVSDGHGGTAHEQLYITINGVNDAISINDDCTSIFDVSNSPSGVCNLEGNVTCNDHDPDFNDVIKVDAWATVDGNLVGNGHTCTPSIAFTQTGYFGTLSLYRDGHYTLDVNQAHVNALGADETTSLHYTFHVTDGHGGGGIEHLNIVVHGTNDAPLASASHFYGAATEDSVYCDSGNLLGAFSDAENNTLTFHVPCAPSGTTSITSAYGTFHITSDGDWKFDLDNASTAVQAIAQCDFRTVDFAFSVTDGHGGHTLSDVVITINGANDAPVGAHHSFTAAEQGFFNAGFNPGHDAAGNLLPGVMDDVGDLHTVVGVWDGTGYAHTMVNAYGTAHVTASGNFQFTVNQGAAAVNAIKYGDVANVDLTYQVMDNHGAMGTGHVVVEIVGFDDAPNPNRPALTVTEDGTLHDAATFQLNDPEGTGFIFEVNGHSFHNGLVTITDSFGTLAVTTDGDVSFSLNNASLAVQDLGVHGTAHDFFHFRVADSFGHTVSSTIDVLVNGANDAPVAGSDVANLFLVSGPNVSGTALANDHDIDIGDALHFTGFASATSMTGTYGHLTLGANGHYLYHVNTANAAVQALSGTHTLGDAFTYHVSDGHGGTAAGTINVVIHGGNNNHAPVANPDSGTATEAGSNATGALPGSGASGNVLTNDTDADNGDTRVVLALNGIGIDVGQATYGVYGWLTLNADGTYGYVVDDANSTVNALRPANNITDTFTYTVQDSHGATATSTLTITITGQNDEPTGSVSISGTPVAGNFLSAVNNLADPEGVASAFSYQWQSNGVDIGGANTQTFQMTAAQAGTTIGVVVTYTDGGGTIEHATATLQAQGGQNILGTKGPDSLSGGAGDDTIDGGLGRDTMSGGAGNDTYYANDTRDVVIENANGGNDTIIASANYTLPTNVENLMLAGAAQQAHGNDLDNMIFGNEKANSIWGMGGADTLTGGKGADTFIYNSLSDTPVNGYDTITDFNAKEKDKIDLRLIDANSFVPGNQAFKFIGSADFTAGNNTGLLRFDPITHMLEGSTNSDANPEFRILLIGVDHIGNDAGGITAANILL